MDLERQLQIKDEYLELIIGLGFDYDGFNSSENLKGLIDEIVDLAKKARNCDDKSVIYGGNYDGIDMGEPTNILMEKVEE